VAKLLGLLVDRGRVELLPAIAEVYSERLLEHQNVVQADVTTAVQLATDRIAGETTEADHHRLVTRYLEQVKR
jgi:F0F1-type ATP synthase delta subunit